MRRLAVPFLLAAVLTGCSSTQPGTPTAGNQTPTTGTSAGSAPVNRPKAVDLKTVDPCALVTPEAKASLGIRTVEPRDPLAEYGEGSKTCGTSYEDRKYIWSIHTILNGGVDKLKSGGEDKLTRLEVARYPGYQTKNDPPESCRIYVDTHDDQLLLVSVVTSIGSDATVDGACERVRPLADAAVAVLATK